MVDACIARLNPKGSSEPLEKIFISLVTALWLRSSRTLSAVTLNAIFDRALYMSSAQFPLLTSFKLDQGGLHLKGEFSPERSADRPQMIESFRNFLVTLLTLFGNLTADILLIGLYQELQAFSFHSEFDEAMPGPDKSFKNHPYRPIH